MDLLELVKGSINNQVAGQMATALGTDAQTAGKAINSVLPQIFAGLAKQVATPAGASSLSSALDKVDSGMLDHLSSELSGAKLASVIDGGTKLLPSIFGSSYSTMYGSLGKTTGLGTAKIGPFLGMLAPIVMAVISKAKKSSGLDLAGLSQLLVKQTQSQAGLDNDRPKELAAAVSLASAERKTMGSAGSPIRKRTVVTRGGAARGGASLSKVLIVILGLATAGLAYYVLVYSRDRGEVTMPKNNQLKSAKAADETPKTPPSRPARPSTAEAPDSTAPAADPTQAAMNFLKDASKAFTEIKDEASAKTAAETLQSLAGKVDTLGLDKLTGPAKLIAVPAVKKFLDEAKTWAEKAYAVPGVQPVLEPAVNAIVDKLKGFAG